MTVGRRGQRRFCAARDLSTASLLESLVIELLHEETVDGARLAEMWTGQSAVAAIEPATN